MIQVTSGIGGPTIGYIENIYLEGEEVRANVSLNREGMKLLIEEINKPTAPNCEQCGWPCDSENWRVIIDPFDGHWINICSDPCAKTLNKKFHATAKKRRINKRSD